MRVARRAVEGTVENWSLGRKTGMVALALLVPAGGWFGTAVTAAADEWGDLSNSVDGVGPHPDPDPHTYCYVSVPAGLQVNIEAAMWNAMDPTAINVDFNSTCDLSGTTETDIVWVEDDLFQATGETRCDNWATYCDQSISTLDLAAINIGAEDEIDQTQTACHEAGHSAGLKHGGSSEDCMINTGDTPPTAIQYRRYGAHHQMHFDAWFN